VRPSIDDIEKLLSSDDEEPPIEILPNGDVVYTGQLKPKVLTMRNTIPSDY
jgi:hypothetical protein